MHITNQLVDRGYSAVKCQVDTLLVEIEVKNKEIAKLKEGACKDQAKIARQRSEIESLLQRKRNEPANQNTATIERPIISETITSGQHISLSV